MGGIIDSHTHRYPPEVFADPAGWAAVHGEPNWAALTVPGGLQGWADRDRMLRDMDAAGVEKAVLQGWYWENQTSCDLQNRWHAEWAARDPDRFIALATVQPKAGAAAVEGLRRALDAGCRGLGELHPWAQGWTFDCEAWREIAAICEARDLPVCFHVTEPLGREYKGSTPTPLAEFIAMARAHPSLRLVLAHWGGGLPFFLMNKWTRASLANVWYDTAASPLLYDVRVWKTCVGLAGADRILFGTDYPLRVYPSAQKEPDFGRLVAEARANLTAEALDAVLRGNAVRVYGA